MKNNEMFDQKLNNIAFRAYERRKQQKNVALAFVMMLGAVILLALSAIPVHS